MNNDIKNQPILIMYTNSHHNNNHTLYNSYVQNRCILKRVISLIISMRRLFIHYTVAGTNIK